MDHFTFFSILLILMFSKTHGSRCCNQDICMVKTQPLVTVRMTSKRTGLKQLEHNATVDLIAHHKYSYWLTDWLTVWLTDWQCHHTNIAFSSWLDDRQACCLCNTYFRHHSDITGSYLAKLEKLTWWNRSKRSHYIHNVFCTLCM